MTRNLIGAAVALAGNSSIFCDASFRDVQTGEFAFCRCFKYLNTQIFKTVTEIFCLISMQNMVLEVVTTLSPAHARLLCSKPEHWLTSSHT